MIASAKLICFFDDEHILKLFNDANNAGLAFGIAADSTRIAVGDGSANGTSLHRFFELNKGVSQLSTRSSLCLSRWIAIR